MYLSMPLVDGRPIVAALGLLVLGIVITFFVKLYKARMLFVELRRQGLVSGSQAYLINSEQHYLLVVLLISNAVYATTQLPFRPSQSSE